jgi:two-component system, chemotaxis family, chemotaxis protein CheY
VQSRSNELTLDLSMRVLVVDDSSAISRVMHGLVRQIGFQNVDGAAGGLSALAKMRAIAYPLVICDKNMQPMTGLDLLHQVRADRELADSCFVLVSADSRHDAVLAAQKAGADGYIVKPFTAETLKSAIAKAMDRTRSSTDDDDIISID